MASSRLHDGLDRSRSIRRHAGALLLLFYCVTVGGTQVRLAHQATGASDNSERQAGHTHSSTTAADEALQKVSVTIPDLSLVNEKGERVALRTDLVRNKVVVIGFFYTSCEFICTIQGKVFTQLQSRLGSRLGKEVSLILATRDPQTDTPQVLRQWAARFKAKSGWVFLTGSVQEINRLLLPLTGDIAGRVEMHSSIIYIGNDRTGDWYRASGISDPDELIKAINLVAKAN